MSDKTQRREVRRFIQDQVVALLHLDAETVVMVTELQCTEPGCPPVETVIAVLVPGAKRQFKIHKQLTDVTTHDLEAALAGEPHDHA